MIQLLTLETQQTLIVIGIAVISLAFQLSDQVIKLHDFWQSVTNAPEDINAILEDLKLLSTILTEIAFTGHQSQAQQLPSRDVGME